MGGVTYRHYAHRDPLPFNAIQTIPQPIAFMGLVKGLDGQCPCCRRPFAGQPVREDERIVIASLSADQTLFGARRAVAFVRAHLDQLPNEIIRELFQAVLAHCNDAVLDEMSALIVSRSAERPAR